MQRTVPWDVLFTDVLYCPRARHGTGCVLRLAPLLGSYSAARQCQVPSLLQASLCLDCSVSPETPPCCYAKDCPRWYCARRTNLHVSN